MRLNDFSVRVIGGSEEAGGYVEMTHGRKYTLCLHNYRSVACNAQVSIDGKDVGTWRIAARLSIRLERPAHDSGRFTFYELGTEDAEAAQIPSGMEAGLVRVVFTPAQYICHSPIGWKCHLYPMRVEYSGKPTTIKYTVENNTRAVSGTPNATAGGTGLSGHSEQEFGDAPAVELDHSQQTTIHLRLVCGRSGEGPRPLTQLSTPIPPALK